jgi:CheY-like chemotaxis protein
LDLNIPGGKGALYAVKSIREKDPTVPIYVTTGYYDDPILENFQQFGFTGVLAKPFNLMDLGKKFSEK